MTNPRGDAPVTPDDLAAIHEVVRAAVAWRSAYFAPGVGDALVKAVDALESRQHLLGWLYGIETGAEVSR